MSRPLWFTTGGGFAEYTELEHDALMDNLLGQGVIPARAGTYVGRLAVTSGAGTAIVAAGAAMVDKKLCAFESGATLNVPTATAGTTGHRVVVRKDAAGKTATLVLKSAADGTATPPTESQTPGGLYEISLATLTRTTGGTITLTDVRPWAIGRGIPRYIRQGGSATDWTIAGSTAYEPTSELVQRGSATVAFSASTAANVAVTFPQAYPTGTKPHMQLTMAIASGVATNLSSIVANTSNTGFTIYATFPSAETVSLLGFWTAIGPAL